MSKELYPYQSKCHESIISEYDKTVLKQLIILFTGAGKTYILIKLLEKMGFKRVLWLSFQEELVSQSALAFIKEKFDEPFYEYVKEIGFLEYINRPDAFFAMNDFKMGCIKAQIFKPDANVVMGSVMTVAKRLDRLAPDYFDCIICDEAHLFGSMSAFNTINHFTPKLLIGATATAYRQDGMMLGDIFDKITFEYGLDKGIKDGYAAELDAIRVKTTTSLDKVKTTAGELNQKDLSNEVNNLARNQLIVDKWKQYATGRQTIAFCVDIEHAIDLADTFKRNGINSVAVSSDEERTPDRSENIKLYKEGKIDVITNVGILVAGFDHVDTGCAIMACPTKSLTKYLQSVGRSARLKTKGFVEKFGQNAIILDIVDSTNRHNLINAWELDKVKDIEDRIFVSREKKDLLLAERLKKSVKLEHERKEDEIVNLLRIPKIKINFDSENMRKAATLAQLAWIEKLGFNITDNHYTNAMCQEIIGQELLSQKKVEEVKKLGYDISGKILTNSDYNAVMRELWIKNNKKK
jgi:superfamily II DNA or RNA helicase